MANFQGRWKLVNTEGFDDYMKALGVGAIQRTIGNATKPVQTITVNGDQLTINISSMVNTAEISFTLGQEFDETTGDGRACKTTITLEGDNKLIQSQKGPVDSVLTRELTDPNTMVMTLVAKDAKAVRTYKRE